MLEEVILKKLLERIRVLQQDVLETPPSNHETFQRVVGTYQGLKEAVQIVEDILKGKEEL